MTWRDELAAMKAEVHDTFAVPVTVHFPEGNFDTTARHHRAGSVVGEDGYSQAIISQDRLVFQLADLQGKDLSRCLAVTIPDGKRTIANVHPPDISQQSVDIGSYSG